jgi:glycosyltransferase involved in cell wall biosynthesis
MAAARPVVATAVGGASEAVADNVSGFLVASNDHGALAQRIVELLRDPEKAAKMGNAGRKIVEDKFSIDGQFAKVMRLYCRLLDQ